MRSDSLIVHLLCGALVMACSPAPSSSDGSSGGDDSETGAVPTSGTGEPEVTSSSSGGDSSSSSGAVEDETDTGVIGDGECDPWLQDCPDGLKCMAYAEPGVNHFTGNKCTPVAQNPGVAGDPCYADGGWSTGVDDCDYGLACWNIDPETSEGVCMAWCTGSADAATCPDAGDTCVFWVPGFAHICLSLCDPLLQDCDGPESCLPNWAKQGEEWVCSLDYSFDEGQEFDPCEYSNACDPGMICTDPKSAIECDPGAIGCCISVCDTSAPNSCEGQGAECQGFYGEEPAPPNYANVGLCSLPS